MRLTDHVPERPTWVCRVCGDPWPCDSAKSALRVEYRTTPTALSLYLAQQWQQASIDLKDALFGDAELLPRFIGWRR